MNSVKNVNLLPVNSFELERLLTELGTSLLALSKEYDFSKKCMGIEDCDFIRCLVIEFTSEIKPDFIAYYGIYYAGLFEGESVKISGEELPEQVVINAAMNAKERKLRVVSPLVDQFFLFKFFLLSRLNAIKENFYKIKISYRNRWIKRRPLPQPKPDQFKLMMSTYNRNTIFTLTPIQDRLKNRSDVCQLYIANRYETYQRLVKLGYPGIINGWSLLPKKQATFKWEVFDDFVDIFFDNYFTFGKATNYFKNAFIRKLRQKLIFLMSLYFPLRKVMEEYNPDVLLLSSSSTADGQLLIHLAEAKKVKIIEMTHGIFQETPLLKFQNVPLKLVWCERQRDLMKKYRPEVECLIVGNPKHDELLFRFTNNPSPRIHNKPYILFASTPGNNISISRLTYKAIMKDIIVAARKFMNYDFIFKIHPSERIEEINLYAKELNAPDNFIVMRDVDVYNILYYCEVVIVVTSTIGFEALLFDKKIICYTIPNSDKWLPFPEFGLAKSASNEAELIECIDYFLINDSLTLLNKNKTQFVVTDGKSMQRVEEILFGSQFA